MVKVLWNNIIIMRVISNPVSMELVNMCAVKVKQKHNNVVVLLTIKVEGVGCGPKVQSYLIMCGLN